MNETRPPSLRSSVSPLWAASVGGGGGGEVKMEEATLQEKCCRDVISARREGVEQQLVQVPRRGFYRCLFC